MGAFSKAALNALAVAQAVVLAGCVSPPELPSRSAELILVGKVTATTKIGLLRPSDPDQEFLGYVYTFQTLQPNGAPGPVTAFAGESTGCPSDQPSDQAYVVFLAKKHNWYIGATGGVQYAGDWSKVWSLRACAPVDEKTSAGFLGYFGPPIFP